MTAGRRAREIVSFLEPARLAEALSTTGFALVGKSAGFLVPFFIASWFGVSDRTDAFFLAYGAILFLAGVFGPVLEVIVPFVADSRGDREALSDLMSRVLTTGTVVVLAAMVTFLFLLVPALPLVTRFSSQSVGLVVRLVIETGPLVVLMLWTNVLSGYLNAHRAFAVPAATPAVRALVNVGVIVALKESVGVHALAVGYIAGEAARLAVLADAVRRRAPFHFRPAFRGDARTRDFYRASAYPVAGMVWILMSPLVDSAMASWLAPGSVSVLRYAENLYMIPFTLFTGGLVTVLLAHWSERFRDAGGAGLEREVSRSTRGVFWLALGAAAVLIAVSRPLTALLLAHGSFDPARAADVAAAWSCYLIGLPAHAAAQLQVKALLVLKRTRVLMTSAIAAVILNAGLNLALMNVLGVAGITLSTSATSVATALYLARKLKAAFADSAAVWGRDHAAVAR